MKPHYTSNHDLVLKLKRFGANNKIAPSFSSFPGDSPSDPVLTTITDELDNKTLRSLNMMVTCKLAFVFVQNQSAVKSHTHLIQTLVNDI